MPAARLKDPYKGRRFSARSAAAAAVNEERLALRYDKDGWSLKKCKEKFGVASTEKVKEILARQGVTLRSARPGPDDTAVLRSYARFRSVETVSRLLGISYQKAVAVLDAHGVPHNEVLKVTHGREKPEYRPLTASQDSRSRIAAARGPRPGSTSRFKGVPLRRGDGKWIASIGHKGTVYLGSYDSEADAARAYDAKAVELRGEYAVTNQTLGLY